MMPALVTYRQTFNPRQGLDECWPLEHIYRNTLHLCLRCGAVFVVYVVGVYTCVCYSALVFLVIDPCRA